MPATCSTTRSTRFGFARGSYEAQPDDGLALVDARITNAVRCVPPENKPTPAEIKTCRVISRADHRRNAQAARHRDARADLARERRSRRSTTAGRRRRSAHGSAHDIGKLRVFVSYHCSRYNTNTGVLTPDMFREVFAQVRVISDA